MELWEWLNPLIWNHFFDIFKQTPPEIFRFDSIVQFFSIRWLEALQLITSIQRIKKSNFFFHHMISDQTFSITHPENNQPQFDETDQYHCALFYSIICHVFFPNSLRFLENLIIHLGTYIEISAWLKVGQMCASFEMLFLILVCVDSLNGAIKQWNISNESAFIERMHFLRNISRESQN